jgi:MoaA/NifB/PqqE/SkfB family radical SAM enzyme
VYCNIWKMKPCSNPLTPTEVETILRDKLFENVEYVINSGGEPMMRPDIKQVFKAEHEALPRSRLQLSTNGLMPDRTLDLVEYVLFDLHCPLDVGVSLDGVGSAHDASRGVRGNFDSVDKLLRGLVALKREHALGDMLNITAGATLTDQTCGHLDQAYQYADSLGVPFMCHWFNQSDFYGNSRETDRTSAIVRGAVEKYVPHGIYQEMWLESLKTGSLRDFNCFALQTFLVLKCNGSVAPCLSLWETVIGNLRETSPQKVWTDAATKKARSIVSHCKGCLNSWGVGWSLATSYYPLLSYELKRRIARRI